MVVVRSSPVTVTRDVETGLENNTNSTDSENNTAIDNTRSSKYTIIHSYYNHIYIYIYIYIILYILYIYTILYIYIYIYYMYIYI